MNQLVTQDRNKLISTLQNSLYVGAKKESVEMVISYCEAAGLDVMQKPAHIVPMNTRNTVTNNYEWRDVIMPGIGLYRIQSDRAGTFAGISEPEFGPDITETFTDKNGASVEFTFPEWCKITVKKLVGSHFVDVTAKEYWVENYATDSGKSTAPNSMWRKRKRGQLAKCAEAQALRKGWPDKVSQAPTAEEMEGKIINMGTAERVDTGTGEIKQAEPELLPIYTGDQFIDHYPDWMARIKAGSTTPERLIAMLNAKYTLTDKQKDIIHGKNNEWLTAYNNAEADQ